MRRSSGALHRFVTFVTPSAFHLTGRAADRFFLHTLLGFLHFGETGQPAALGHFVASLQAVERACDSIERACAPVLRPATLPFRIVGRAAGRAARSAARHPRGDAALQVFDERAKVPVRHARTKFRQLMQTPGGRFGGAIASAAVSFAVMTFVFSPVLSLTFFAVGGMSVGLTRLTAPRLADAATTIATRRAIRRAAHNRPDGRDDARLPIGIEVVLRADDEHEQSSESSQVLDRPVSRLQVARGLTMHMFGGVPRPDTEMFEWWNQAVHLIESRLDGGHLKLDLEAAETLSRIERSMRGKGFATNLFALGGQNAAFIAAAPGICGEVDQLASKLTSDALTIEGRGHLADDTKREGGNVSWFQPSSPPKTNEASSAGVVVEADKRAAGRVSSTERALERELIGTLKRCYVFGERSVRLDDRAAGHIASLRRRGLHMRLDALGEDNARRVDGACRRDVEATADTMLAGVSVDVPEIGLLRNRLVRGLRTYVANPGSNLDDQSIETVAMVQRNLQAVGTSLDLTAVDGPAGEAITKAASAMPTNRLLLVEAHQIASRLVCRPSYVERNGTDSSDVDRVRTLARVLMANTNVVHRSGDIVLSPSGIASEKTISDAIRGNLSQVTGVEGIAPRIDLSSFTRTFGHRIEASLRDVRTKGRDKSPVPQRDLRTDDSSSDQKRATKKEALAAVEVIVGGSEALQQTPRSLRRKLVNLMREVDTGTTGGWRIRPSADRSLEAFVRTLDRARCRAVGTDGPTVDMSRFRPHDRDRVERLLLSEHDRRKGASVVRRASDAVSRTVADKLGSPHNVGERVGELHPEIAYQPLRSTTRRMPLSEAHALADRIVFPPPATEMVPTSPLQLKPRLPVPGHLMGELALKLYAAARGTGQTESFRLIEPDESATGIALAIREIHNHLRHSGAVVPRPDLSMFVPSARSAIVDAPGWHDRPEQRHARPPEARRGGRPNGVEGIVAAITREGFGSQERGELASAMWPVVARSRRDSHGRVVLSRADRRHVSELLTAHVANSQVEFIDLGWLAPSCRPGIEISIRRASVRRYAKELAGPVGPEVTPVGPEVTTPTTPESTPTTADERSGQWLSF